MTDRIVLERFVEGNDHDAFRVLIDRHGAMVLAVCRSILREKHDAEDAFQTTFLTLARRAATIKKSDSVAPWLHRVALRVSHRVRHRESRNRAIEQIRSDREPMCPFELRDLSFIPLVHEEVNRLPERYRLPVVLCYLDGKTNEEAAAHLKCPVGTVKGRLSRARESLRNRLRGRGLDADWDSRPALGDRRPAT